MRQWMMLALLFGLLGFGSFPKAWADGKDVTVQGEVIDTFCYLTMGAKGASHKTCGMECARKGSPVGLLEEGTGKLYTLLPEKDKTSLPDSVVSKMGETAVVTGDAYSQGGSQYLRVEKVS